MATQGFNDYIKRAFVMKELSEIRQHLKSLQENVNDIWEELSKLKEEY